MREKNVEILNGFVIKNEQFNELKKMFYGMDTKI